MFTNKSSSSCQIVYDHKTRQFVTIGTNNPPKMVQLSIYDYAAMMR